MSVKLKSAAQRLVLEFETKLGLSAVNSRRAAFVVLATAQGWQKAKMARYLDVSRARVGQRVDKYKEYQATGYLPILEGFDLDHSSSNGQRNRDDPSPLNVSFSVKDWEDPEFTDSLLNRLAMGIHK